MRARYPLAMATVVALLLFGTPAKGAEYKYDLFDFAWPQPNELTVCFYEGKAYTHRFSSGAHEARPLLDGYRQFVRGAAKVWTDTPGIPITITVVDRCTKETDVRVVGVRLGRWESSGIGGCVAQEDKKNVVHTRNVCAPRSGIVAINTDIPTAGYGRFWLYTSLHELGHVLGLAHAESGGCDNECYGPVMSYGSYKSEKKAAGAPDGNDQAGIRHAYYGSPNPGGGGGCVALPASTAGVVTMQAAETAAEATTDPDLHVVVPRPEGIPDLLDDAPVHGQVGSWDPAPAFDPLEDAARLAEDPLGYTDESVDELLSTILLPEVDAHATLVGTIGKGWKSVEYVLKTNNLPNPLANCL